MSAPNLVPSDAATSTEPTSAMRPDSEYADQMPRLRRYAALHEGDPRRAALREELILAFLPVVENLAKRHGAGYPASNEDLVQVGTIGLINAVDRWDPDRAQGDFLGYLIPCVRGEILRYFRDRTWSTRVPRRLKELSVAITRATGPLSQSLGRAPRPSELAEHLKADVSEIIDALGAKNSHHAGPLDASDPETDSSLADRLGELDGELETVEYRHALRPLLAELPDRERTILLLRFFGEMTQTQIADRIGISQMHVSRLLSRTLEQLRQGLVESES